MTLKEKWNASAKLRLLGAVLLNALVLACMLAFIQPGFESNDDQTLAAFVDGQTAVKDAHIPYMNYALTNLLKGLYLLGDTLPWFTILQYALLFAGFTALTWIMFERLRAWQGAALTVMVLVLIGVDSYTSISYTKTAAVCTIAGLALMLHAMEFRAKGRRALPVVLGGVLVIFGAMLRFMEFLPCAALMSVLGLRYIWGVIADKGIEKKLSAIVRYALPFAAVLVIAAGLYAFDGAVWSRGEWGTYRRFDDSRIALTDYGIPAYEEMPDAYESLGLSKTAVELLRSGNFYEPDLFNKATIEAITAAKSEAKPAPSLGECLGKLLDTCTVRFFDHQAVYLLLIVFALWLACGEHDLRGWFTFAIELGMFCVFYLYLIRRGRYLVDRVDMGLFMAVVTVLLWTLKRELLDKERVLSALLLACALFTSYMYSRTNYRFGSHSTVEDKSELKQAVDTLLSDNDCLYLSKIDPLDKAIYSAFETPPDGYWDRIVTIGGWLAQNPIVARTMADYGVVNPYRDIVDKDNVYIIDDDIDLTISFINEYYDPDASAELVEPLSRETGLEIYRITG